MQNTMFHPASKRDDRDPVAQLLLRVSQNIFVLVIGLLPLLFLPVAYAPFNYSKVFFVLIGVIVAVIFFALSVLREGEFPFRVPLALCALWGLVGVYIVSTILSGDMKDAFIGDAFNVHTTAFLMLCAAIITAATILRDSKVAIVRLYGLLIVSSIVLALFHISRIFLGADFLALGTFSNLVSSPLGAWNGIALFSGLVILIALVALEQLPLTRIGKIVLSISALLALCMLVIVNFSAVWGVLAGVSSVILIYSLVRKHYQKTGSVFDGDANQSFFATIAATIVFALSIFFVIGGSTLGTTIGEWTGISQVEVRPSFSATFDVARSVYSESPILGIGPNKFSDAWRLYKDPSINQTIFWNTNFETGSGFIPTSFVTTGILGGVMWLLFFALLLYHGFVMFIRRANNDRFWNFIGASSFIGTVYLWGMSFIYTPTAAILLLAAACTGVFITAYSVLVPQKQFTLSVAANRALGFVFVGAVVLVIFGSVATLYAVGQHYGALYSFNKVFATVTEDDTLDTVQQRITEAYDRSSNDIFTRQIAQYRLAQINALLNREEPTSKEQQDFQTAVADGVQAAQIATDIDPTEPRNWQVLGQIYSALTLAGVDGAAERATNALDTAQQYDPQNPAIVLLQAQLASRTGDMERARALAEQAVDMKRNYTDALLFLSQIDIVNNDVQSAIARTESIISIEPNNPARYYQLGVLESANGNQERAIAAFQRAIALDNDYANARYFLALAYAEQGRTEAAIEQLEVVAELNPDNTDIPQMITRLQSGESITDPQDAAALNSSENIQDGEEVTASSVSETSLVSPVGTVPEDEVSATSSQESSETPATTTTTE